MAAPGLQGEHLRPPDTRKLIPFLDWLGLWRVVPEVSPALLGTEELLLRARKQGYTTRVDTVVGPALGLSADGERLVGKPVGLRRMSLEGVNQRALLHLVAAQHGLPVVGFSRVGLMVEVEDGVKLLGWGSGDLKAGLLGSGADYEISLPKQMDLGSYGLSDAQWLSVSKAVLLPPTVPMRGRYWTRTLLEVALLVMGQGEAPPGIGAHAGLLRAVRWFTRERIGSWERVEALLG
jgi:hypothetical protein